MMKKYFVWLLLYVAGAAFATDAETISKGSWFAITKGETTVYFYDPYQTKVNEDGVLESMSYGRHMLDGSVTKLTFINVDCANKTLRTYISDEGTGRKMVRDWHVPRGESVGEGWVKALCGYKTEDGIKIDFVGLFEHPYDPERSTYIFWLPEIELSPSVLGGKTYQLVYYVQKDGRGYDGYLYLDCKNDAYATSMSLDIDLALLYWEKNPPLEAVSGYLMTKACGPSSNSRIRSQ